jgi:hypothetical protein
MADAGHLANLLLCHRFQPGGGEDEELDIVVHWGDAGSRRYWWR